MLQRQVPSQRDPSPDALGENGGASEREVTRRSGGTGGYSEMIDQEARKKAESLTLGMLVDPVEELAGVQALDGEQIAREELGPGIVEEVRGDDAIRVHWTRAGTDAWMDPGDVR